MQAPSAGVKIPILFGAVLALAAACIYLFYQLNDIKSQLAATSDRLEADITKLSETSSVTTATSRRNIDKLESDLAQGSFAGRAIERAGERPSHRSRG